MANMVAMATKVEEYLSLEDSPHQKTALTTDSWDIVRLLEADADWTSLATMQRDKISAINALGGPRVMCVWSGTCAQLQRLPRYPDDVAHILDAELVVSYQTPVTRGQSVPVPRVCRVVAHIRLEDDAQPAVRTTATRPAPHPRDASAAERRLGVHYLSAPDASHRLNISASRSAALSAAASASSPSAAGPSYQ